MDREGEGRSRSLFIFGCFFKQISWVVLQSNYTPSSLLAKAQARRYYYLIPPFPSTPRNNGQQLWVSLYVSDFAVCKLNNLMVNYYYLHSSNAILLLIQLIQRQFYFSVRLRPRSVALCVCVSVILGSPSAACVGCCWWWTLSGTAAAAEWQ